MINLGYQFVTVSSDFRSMTTHAQGIVNEMKNDIKQKSKEIIDANKLGFVSNERSTRTGTFIEMGLSLPDRRGKGKIIDGPTNDAVAQLVKILREQEKVV